MPPAQNRHFPPRIREVGLKRRPAGHSEQLETPVISRQVERGSQEGAPVVLRHPAQAVGVDCIFDRVEQEPPKCGCRDDEFVTGLCSRHSYFSADFRSLWRAPAILCRQEGVPGERWILTSLWKTAWPNSSSRPSGFERPMKHRISVTNEGKLMVTIKLGRA